VQGRRPAQLRVARAVAGHVFHELGGGPLEGVGVLEQGHRKVEGPQQLRLVAAVRRRHEARAQRGDIEAVRQSGRSAIECQLEGGLEPQRAIEVEVQLRLGHGRQPPAQRAGGSGIAGWVHERAGHDAMLASRSDHRGRDLAR
jgi:hypothetical protein